MIAGVGLYCMLTLIPVECSGRSEVSFVKSGLSSAICPSLFNSLITRMASCVPYTEYPPAALFVKFK